MGARVHRCWSRLRWVAPLIPVGLTVAWTWTLEPRPEPGVTVRAVRQHPAEHELALVAIRTDTSERQGGHAPSLARDEPGPTDASRREAEPGEGLEDEPGDDVELNEDQPASIEILDPCEEELEHTLGRRDAAQAFYVEPTDDRPVVSLTFDDGPSRLYTRRVLRVLASKDVKATFFMLGHRVEDAPELVAEVAEAGHDVGNHTWSHPSMRSLWKTQIRDEVCRTQAAIVEASGVRPTLFRPPFGRYPESSVPLLGGLDYDMVLWSVDSHDWELDEPSAVAQTVLSQVSDRAIILLHDTKGVTWRALPQIIDGLRARGFAIEPISNVVRSDIILAG